MTKRKTAESALTEPAAAEPVKKRTAAKPKTAAAATHKRTSKPSVTSPIVALPTHEEVALRAYSYWESRGYQGGSPQEDWLRAERELAELA